MVFGDHSFHTSQPMIRSIAVFCGSSRGTDPEFASQARLLGESLAIRDIEVVYGGAMVGLMNEVAEGALSAGGHIIGVMPRFLVDKEIAHKQLTELILVDSMHERKLAMNDRCDGVIAMPGGFGTLDELFEMITWAQLGLHFKPIGILNTKGFYDPLIAQINMMTSQGFLKAVHRDMLIVSDGIDSLLHGMQHHRPPTTGKWL